MEIALIVAALIVGALLGWIFGKNRTDSQIDAERAKVLELTNALAATEANYRNLEEKLEEGKTYQKTMTDQFKVLAQEVLDANGRKLSEENRSNIFDILKPLNEKIIEFQKTVQDTHKDTIERHSALRQQIEDIQRTGLQMTREAENLTRALKGDSQAQGAWGEFILESILQKSGLERDREYTIQETFLTNDGRRRPDVIIRLPHGRHVIIDSKVTLTSYNNFVNSDRDEDKTSALKAHMYSIRQHMKSLGEKNYQGIAENGLDFIIMFIPIEPAYILAIQTDPDLYEEALERRIIFVSPTLLIPSLQLIKNVWKQEYQNRHVLDIASKAGDLYDKFVGFSDDLLKLGESMNSAKRFYDESMKKLSSGAGNIVTRVEELKKLGARATKSIDKKLLGRSEDQADLFNQ